MSSGRATLPAIKMSADRVGSYRGIPDVGIRIEWYRRQATGKPRWVFTGEEVVTPERIRELEKTAIGRAPWLLQLMGGE